MTHHLSLDSILRAIRGTVCVMCYQRPLGSEYLPNTLARGCEEHCPVFCHLPALIRIAVHGDTNAPGALDSAVRNQICTGCTMAPTAGERCVEFDDRTCPLSRYGRDVVTLIEALREWQHHRPEVSN
jgi:hypothetical protein